MARVQFDLQVRGTVTDADAGAFERSVTTFREACLANGLEVRGDGLEVVRDAVIDEAPATTDSAIEATGYAPPADPPVDPPL